MADDKGRIVWFENHVMHVDLDHQVGREWSIAFLKVAIEKLKKQRGSRLAVGFMDNMLRVLIGKLQRHQFPGNVEDLEVCHIKQTEDGDIIAEQDS